MSPPRKAAGPSINPEMTVDGPNLSQLQPNSLLAGSPPATVDVYGTGFDPTCVIQGDGAARVTFFLDDGHLQFTARPDIETGATVHQINVLNGAGQISNVLPLAITGPPSTATIGFWTCECGISVSSSRPVLSAPICVCQRTMTQVAGKVPKVLFEVVFVDQQDQKNR